MVFILPFHCRFKGLLDGNVLPRCGRRRALSDSITFLSLSSCFCVCITYVFCFHVLNQSSFMLCLFNMFLFGYFSVFALFLFFFIKKKKKLKNQKNTKTVCVLYIGTCIPWMAI